ncbi:MAG TPA: GAF domain-containing protein, partial [bacterium (Candidatus Stahlbacteria)]|nr:GAF domain-containing protein [Candidatus Stahlbacteria bacterium]
MDRLAIYLNKLLNWIHQEGAGDINWQRIAKGIPDIVSCDGVGIRLYDPRTNRLRLVASIGFPESYNKKMGEVEMPDIAWTIVKSGGPLIPENYRIHPAYQAWIAVFQRLKIKKNLVVGIFIDDKFLGYISLVRKKNIPFKKSEAIVLKIVANSIARELSRFYHLNIESSLYQFFLRIKKRVGFKEFFDEILEIVSECFNVNGSALFLLDGKILKPVSIYGNVIMEKTCSIVEAPELIENMDIRHAFVLSKERSEIFCKPGHQVAVAPIPLPHDQRGFFILCFPKRYLLTNDDLALLYIWTTAISDYLINIHALHQLSREKKSIENLSRSTILALVSAFEIRSPHFKNHSEVVAKY